jgi:signal transduction histidine kinase
MKTPLQSIGTALEHLSVQKKDLPKATETLIDAVSEDIERIKAIVNEFVQANQSHSRVLKLKLEITALNQLLPEWIKPFKIVAKDKEVRLNYLQEGSETIQAKLDRVKFPWVISNLVSNAIRFSPPTGEVSILLTDRNGGVEIQVKDEGPGFSADKKEPFGTGLTIAKEVVEAHDGRLEYFRRPTRGSEFRVTLPFP